MSNQRRCHDHAYESGLLVAAFAGTAAVYDLTTHRVWFLQPLAGRLLGTPPGEVDDLVAEVAATSDSVAPDEVRARVDTITVELETAGLLGDGREPWTEPAWAEGPTEECDDCVVGDPFELLDHRVAFRGLDPDLVARTTALVPLRRADARPGTFIDVLDQPDSTTLLRLTEQWRFPTFRALRAQLAGVLADFVNRTGDMLILHAGMVRTPDGGIIGLPGVAEAGKSTLTSALVRAGCDFIGDELVGIRAGSLTTVAVPFDPALDENSREVLGLGVTWDGPYVRLDQLRNDAERLSGDVAPIDRMVVARFDPAVDAVVESARLAPHEAFEALTPAVLNLARCGPEGWATLCALCESTPVTTLEHPDAALAAVHLLAG